MKIDYETTNFIATNFGVPIDKNTLLKGRADIAEQFGLDGSPDSPIGESESSGLQALSGLLFEFPAFMHLWFLWFLCWLILLFLIYAPLADALRVKRIPKWIVSSPASLLWLMPATILTLTFMKPDSFGPDASIGLLPKPSVLSYYAIFFFFGALYFDMDDKDMSLGRHWWVSLAVALVIVFPIGVDLAFGTFGIFARMNDFAMKSFLSHFLQALFAWLMTFASIGACHQFLSHESRAMRYVSDSSYWLYLAHLPLVLLAQWYVKESSIPAY